MTEKAKATALAAMIGALAATAGWASETITYTYDARGRLVRVERSGTVNNNVKAEYAYDKADNRTNVTVSGSTGSGGSPTVLGASYETPEVGTGHVYNPTVPGVTFSNGTGVAGNGSAWGFAAAPDGDQVAFLQSAGGNAYSISHSVTGLTPGASYTVSFYLARRPTHGVNPISVSFNGTSLGTFTPPSNSFTQFTTVTFQASASTGTLTFAGTPLTADSASALDMVTLGIASPSVPNASYEAPDVGAGHLYNPTVPGVTFSNGTGVAGNGSAWGFAAAPDGDQVAFLQSAGGNAYAISHNVSGLTPGTHYTVSFYLARRPNKGINPITVSFGGVNLGTFTPPSNSFTQFTTASFQANATAGMLTFTGTPLIEDSASALDLVTIAASP